MTMLRTQEKFPLNDYLSQTLHIDLQKEVEETVALACQDKNSAAWKELQHTLFDMNVRIMNEGFGLGTPRAVKEWELRNIIEKVEQRHLSKEKIPAELKTYAEFMPWLKERIANHRVNQHALFDLFDADDLTDEELRYFLSNYRVNMQRFHLHVAAFSLIVPFAMREELYHNLYDEFGQGNFAEAHPNLFEPLMDHFGGARDEDINHESCHLLKTKISLCWFADGFYPGIGGMGALELAIPLQQRRVLAHLRRRGLSKELVKFFVVHCELDEDHGEGWFAAGAPYVKTVEQLQTIFSAAMRMLDARAGVYDGVLKGILARRQK
jgi:pyrroloquinoline quinone (PQQ) biosynthesis protein C